ncbi:MAG: hypothetical protein QXU69_07110 [Thermofilaceae archaeon]
MEGEGVSTLARVALCLALIALWFLLCYHVMRYSLPMVTHPLSWLGVYAVLVFAVYVTVTVVVLLVAIALLLLPLERRLTF